MKEKQKSENIFFYAKLSLMNILIFLFGFGVWHLIGKAIDEHDQVIVGELVPIMLAVIGLITLEFNLIFKHIRHRKETSQNA